MWGRHEWAPTARRYQKRLGTQIFQRKGSRGIRPSLPPNTGPSQQLSSLVPSDGARKMPTLGSAASIDRESIMSLAETSECNALRCHVSNSLDLLGSKGMHFWVSKRGRDCAVIAGTCAKVIFCHSQPCLEYFVLGAAQLCRYLQELQKA